MQSTFYVYYIFMYIHDFRCHLISSYVMLYYLTFFIYFIWMSYNDSLQTQCNRFVQVCSRHFMYIIYLCIYMILDVILCHVTRSNYLPFFLYFISFQLFSWIFGYGSSFFFIMAGHLSLIWNINTREHRLNIKINFYKISIFTLFQKI